MKMKKIMALAALATLGMAACSNEEDVQFVDMQDMPITYTAYVNELSSRAGTTLNEGSFGLYLTTEGTQDSKYTAKNLKVSYVNGTWKPASQLLWKDNDSNVSYYAYMPYQEIQDPTKFEVSVTKKQTANDSNDFCYSPVQETNASENNGSINVAFNHALAKLTVSLTPGTELPSGVSFKTLTIDNADLSGIFNLQEGELKSTSNKADKLELQVNKKNEFQAILIPQSFNNLTVTITDNNGKKYQFKSSERLVFNSGKSYQLKLSVGHDKVIMGSITAQPWETVQGGTLVTD